METVRRLLLEAAPDDAIERAGQVRIDLGELRRILLQDRVHRLDVRIALEGAPAGHHFVEDRAEGKDVGAVVERLAADLLGRHVTDGAHDRADSRIGDPRLADVGHRAGQFGCLGESKIEDLDDAVLSDEDVLRLQIPMDDPALVRRRDTADDVDTKVDGGADGKARLAHASAKGVALEQFGDGIDRPALGCEIVDGEDIWMRQRRHSPRLALEPRQRRRILGERLGQGL